MIRRSCTCFRRGLQGHANLPATQKQKEIIMRAVEMTRFGGPEVVRVSEVVKPAAPGPGRVLIRVAAAGINPVDWKIREGYMKDVMPFTFPTILGFEIAGTIEALGEGVTEFAVGDAVNGSIGMTGGYADYTVVDPTNLARKPANISMVDAAAIPVAAGTSRAALDAGKVGRGTRLLVHAAAGGVGSLAVQIARLRGAEVTALASPENFDYVRGLGASRVVDRTSEYENEIGDFDVILDAVGPEAQARSWKLLRRGGILLSLVAPPAEDVAAAHGVRGQMVFGTPTREAIAEVNALVAKGDVKIFVSRTYPVEQAAAALAESQTGKVRGKLILTF
jgi:NADPH:quinone reductase-like Zn-dependent oxidoreductase